jgi:hypothetical protein
MQINGRLHVTNVTDGPILLLGCHLQKPRTDGHVLTQSSESGYFGEYPIDPGRTADVSAHFWIVPPLASVGEEFVATVVLVDQYGNRRKLKNARFASMPSTAGPLSPVLGDLPYSIPDETRKLAASVLSAEVGRYRAFGRRSGGLGSVKTVGAGQTMSALGGVQSPQSSPDSLPLVEDPESYEVQSDNLIALENLRGRTRDGKEEDLDEVLLGYLNRDSPYAIVAYLIVLYALRVGIFREALVKVKDSLVGADQYALSDCLIMIDGLLRLQHHLFSDSFLDAVEELVDGLDSEEFFYIPQRTAAIRAYRLAHP